jgi:hypothetical protein
MRTPVPAGSLAITSMQFLNIQTKYDDWWTVTFGSLQIWQQFVIKVCNKWNCWLEVKSASVSHETLQASIKEVCD